MIGTMAHVCIGVTDLEKSIQYYTTVLGMRLKDRRQLASGTTIVLVGPNGESDIELTYNPLSPTTGLRHVAFWVEDIDKEVASLKQLGVVFYREPAPKGSSSLRVAFFKEPNGADIELMER